MKRHIKRRSMPKEWPLPRKGTKYITMPLPGKGRYALAINIILRDLLKISKTKKETKEILHAKNVLLDNKVIKDYAFPVGLFDIISLPKLHKYYRMEFSPQKKLTLVEIKETESNLKSCKVISKKVLNKGKIQINLHDGKNFLYDQKIKINDSVLIDLKKNKIIKILPLKENASVHIAKGKHMGVKGKILKIEDNITTIKTSEGQIKTIIKNLFVIE